MDALKQYIVEQIMALSPLAVTIIMAVITVVIPLLESYLGKTTQTKSGSLLELVIRTLITLISKVLEALKIKKV